MWVLIFDSWLMAAHLFFMAVAGASLGMLAGVWAVDLAALIVVVVVMGR